MPKIWTEATRENMIEILEAQDMWKTEFLESQSDEDLLEFGILNGIWNKYNEVAKQNNGD